MISLNDYGKCCKAHRSAHPRINSSLLVATLILSLAGLGKVLNTQKAAT